MHGEYLDEVELALDALTGDDHLSVLVHPPLTAQHVVYTCGHLLPVVLLIISTIRSARTMHGKCGLLMDTSIKIAGAQLLSYTHVRLLMFRPISSNEMLKQPRYKKYEFNRSSYIRSRKE